jgi:hypothetical protein
MPEDRPPDLETFARQFRMRYGREMTAEERRFYQLTKKLLDDPPEKEGGEESS